MYDFRACLFTAKWPDEAKDYGRLSAPADVGLLIANLSELLPCPPSGQGRRSSGRPSHTMRRHTRLLNDFPQADKRLAYLLGLRM